MGGMTSALKFFGFVNFHDFFGVLCVCAFRRLIVQTIINSYTNMPCTRCAKPTIDAPSIEDWGSTLWTILHGFAEHSGRNDDERQIWISLLEGLPKIVPCPECAKHLTAWLKKYPIVILRKIPITGFRTWVVNYLYELHEDVNRRLEKPSFPKDKLTETYKSIDLQVNMESLKRYLEKLISISGTGMLSWKSWEGYILRLLTLYNLLGRCPTCR